MEGVEYALRENEVLTANIITGMFNGLALILTATPDVGTPFLR